MVEAVAGDAARHDLALLGLETRQRLGVLEVDVAHLRFAEAAVLRLGRGPATPSARSLLSLHGMISFRLVYQYCFGCKFRLSVPGAAKAQNGMSSTGASAAPPASGIGGTPPAGAGLE